MMLLDELNAQQKLAVTHFGTPLLIVAGAGSGKTLVLTKKIQWLISDLSFPSESILAITFTNKAAREMKERVQNLLQANSDLRLPYIGTFHAFCGDILRQDYHHMSGVKNYSILDPSDQLKIIKDIIKDKRLDEKTYSPYYVLNRISDYKTKLISVEDCKKNIKNEVDEILSGLYRQYQDTLTRHNVIDFGDMIMKTVILFQNFPDILKKYQERFYYVMVDEYQDTNHAQYVLIRLLVGDTQNLTVVGDFDQNIYSWRGADMKYILNFERDYELATTVLLEQNYRSTQHILKAANAVIKNNLDRREKNLWTSNSEGDPVFLKEFHFEHGEAEFVANKVEELQSGDASYSDCVVLVRMNALSRVLEESFRKKNIPYKVIGGMSFFERKEIKDIIAYLRVVFNLNDNLACQRIMNTPTRGIGSTTILLLDKLSLENNLSWYEIIQHSEFDHLIKRKKEIVRFYDMIQDLILFWKSLSEDKISSLIEKILSVTGYKEMLEKDSKKDYQERIENIYELMSVAREEELDLGDFLQKISLESNPVLEEDDNNYVSLMTMHNAKGLEFDYVFICGMEDDILPHYRSKSSPKDLEEERRLCYVAMTRARKQLYLSYVKQRILFGDIRYHLPSPFIDEIPTELIEEVSVSKDSVVSNSGMPISLLSKTDEKSSFANASSSQNSKDSTFTIGEHVQHSAWGVVQVVRISGEGEKQVIHIRYKGEIKKLLARYAPLKKI
ncbi:ATP-dependent DNA helicase PcrA [Candidatus Marinamargulisbacteria bacterium SCGC AG-410-N11]|nr:ATP-dependent DNA helicase PcrA [Candidatus Marinamargulisbacteria bacterium SCGC AG-410-N11]